MNSSTFKTPPRILTIKPPPPPPRRDFPNVKRTQFKALNLCRFNSKKPNLSVRCFDETKAAVGTAGASNEVLGGRLPLLASEFTSLAEPIERVKRLLDYAARLAPLEESARSPANRVTGCTAQVWLEVKMDESGRMRFRANSDSEITKGFISCLVWLLDGARAEEVLAVKAEDLASINVGLYGKAQSRVNTWHNVLIAMQKRTESLATERNGHPPVDPLPALVVAAAAAAEGFGAAGSSPETRIHESRWQELDVNLSRP